MAFDCRLFKYLYYFLGMVLLLSFLVLPLNFFFHAGSPLAEEVEDEEEVTESFGRKFCRALKFTSASVFLLVILVLLGIFLPFEGSAPHKDSLEEKIQFAWNEFKTNEGFDMIVFLLNAVQLVGMVGAIKK